MLIKTVQKLYILISSFREALECVSTTLLLFQLNKLCLLIDLHVSLWTGFGVWALYSTTALWTFTLACTKFKNNVGEGRGLWFVSYASCMRLQLKHNFVSHMHLQIKHESLICQRCCNK